MNRYNMTRRRCVAGIAAALLTPMSATSRAATARSQRWQALQTALEAFVAERSASGVSVAISFGDALPIYRSAGTLEFQPGALAVLKAVVRRHRAGFSGESQQPGTLGERR